MRVLILTPLFPPATGGAAAYFGTIVPKLASLPEITDLIVLTEKYPGLPKFEDKREFSIFRTLPIRVSAPRKHFARHLFSYLQTQLTFSIVLPDLIKRQQIDLIHYHTRFQGRLFFRALDECGVPVIADLRDKKGNIPSLIRHSNLILCCGEGVMHYALSKGCNQDLLRMIPIPFIPPKSATDETIRNTWQTLDIEKTNYILFLGDITSEKGIYALIESFQRWGNYHPDISFFVAGTNREGKRFLKAIKNQNRIRYLGPVSQKQALALIKHALILALPSQSEGLPRVILEAIALGTRVIAPPGIPEFDQYLKEFVLDNISADEITLMLDKLIASNTPPQYPFHKHRSAQVIEKLLKAYLSVTSIT